MTFADLAPHLVLPALCAVAIVIGAVAMLRDIRAASADDPPPLLVPWRKDALTRLQFDGRWRRRGSAFRRRMEAILYAPPARGKYGRKRPRMAVLDHSSHAIGCRVRFGVTELRLESHRLILSSDGFWENPLSLAPGMAQWKVHWDGQLMGELRRETDAIRAFDTHGIAVGVWDTPYNPAGLRPGLSTHAEKPDPVYTRLSIAGSDLRLRLPFMDGRTYRLDFSGRPFLQGTVPEDETAVRWALAFLTVAAQASLNLQAHALNRVG